MIDSQKIADRLKTLRGQKTQEEVANALNISVSAIAMYESGKRIPRDEIKVALANYFETTVEDIFFCH